MTPDEWRERVGRHVENRRRLLFPSRRAAASSSGVSEIVWRQIESGRRQIAPGTVIAPNPEEQTKVSVSVRLRWESDAIDRLLAGEEPVESSDSQGEAATNGDRPDLEQRIDEMAAENERRFSSIEEDLAGMRQAVEALRDHLVGGA